MVPTGGDFVLLLVTLHAHDDSVSRRLKAAAMTMFMDFHFLLLVIVFIQWSSKFADRSLGQNAFQQVLARKHLASHAQDRSRRNCHSN